MKNYIQRLTLLLMFCCSFMFSVHAQNMKKMGDINVHYMAIGATFLTPEIAKAYGIERSRYNGLVNISVLDNTQNNSPAKSVSLIGKARNNVGQLKSLVFREVKEGDAIYYLAEVNYANEETIHFDVQITDGSKKHNLKFSQKFYVD
ncbi:MAG: hypothetical protein ACI9LM_001431 [Alteromonadaceae bacterium]|jgi:hypothetical protein